MGASIQDHLKFWRTLETGLSDLKQPLVKTLAEAKGTLSGTAFEDVAESLIQDISAGSSFSEAMPPHESVFSRAICTMVRAGEAGGVLDVIVGRIAEGIEDGSFVVPDVAAPEAGEWVRFWRAFGRMLSSGVPILETLEILADGASCEKHGKAIEAMRRTIRDGGCMVDAMRPIPDLFPEEVCAAAAAGEEAGDLDKQASRIADALEADDLRPLVEESESAKAARAKEIEDRAPVKLLNLVLLQAIKDRASDIHLDPLEGGEGRVRMRIDGVLYEMKPPAKGILAKVVSRLMVMAAMNIAERRLPQDGRVMLDIDNKKVDLRVSVAATLWGQRAVVRVLRREAAPLQLDKIGFSGDGLEQVRALCHLGSGLVICTGPAGCGKTSLLYAMLYEIDRLKRCVLSIENPVEFALDGVAQMAIRPNIGLTFARALISALRQAPDVIMVGEIRDLQTGEMVVQSALTGHLVFSTLHANTPPGAARRLLDMGIAPFMLNAALSGVIGQRLPRMLCAKCKQKAAPDLQALTPHAVDFVRQAGKGVFYGPKGCEHCNGTGYRGRTGIHEVLIPGEGFRRAVSASADAAALREAALAGGLKPMLTDGLEKAARGITSVEEVCRVVPLGANE